MVRQSFCCAHSNRFVGLLCSFLKYTHLLNKTKNALCDTKILVLLARFVGKYSRKQKKIISMNRKNWYESPALEVVEIAVEAGFSLSGVVGGDDYGDGGYGSEME